MRFEQFSKVDLNEILAAMGQEKGGQIMMPLLSI